MFWKLVVLALVLSAVGIYFFSASFGGLVYVVPVVVVIFVVVRQMARPPNTAFGRWRPANEKHRR